MINYIKDSELSIIIQGPILPITQSVIERVRKIFPEAQIIVSTYPYEKTDIRYADIIILNKDPGAYIQHKRTGTLNNLNRQLQSVKTGLSKANRKYLLKMRSDLLLRDDGFLKIFGNLDKSVPGYRVFEKKILVGSLFSRKKYHNFETPFHISDWFYFGLLRDIKLFFDSIEFVADPSFTYYFKDKNTSPFGSTTFRYSPEQYFTYSVYKRFINKYLMNDASDITESIVKESDRFIISNFLIVNYKSHGFATYKYPCSFNELELGDQWFDLWNEFYYSKRYKELCDPSHVIDHHDQESLYEKRGYYSSLFRLKKHINKAIHANFPKNISYIFSSFAVLVSHICKTPLWFIRNLNKNESNRKNIR